MASINIKNLLGNGEMVYDEIHTEGSFEWFKLSEDGYIYVRNSETGRNTRYNSEAQNGKRISDEEYFTKCNEAMTLEREKATKEMDKAAEDPEVSLEQFCEMVEEANPAPKAKKRAKKGVAFRMDVDGTEVTLTEKQVDFIRHLSDTDFWENGLNSCIWTDVLCDQIGGQFKGKPMTVGAMISTICEKGLGSRSKGRVNNKKCTCFELTALGQIVARELGLK